MESCDGKWMPYSEGSLSALSTALQNETVGLYSLLRLRQVEILWDQVWEADALHESKPPCPAEFVPRTMTAVWRAALRAHKERERNQETAGGNCYLDVQSSWFQVGSLVSIPMQVLVQINKHMFGVPLAKEAVAPWALIGSRETYLANPTSLFVESVTGLGIWGNTKAIWGGRRHWQNDKLCRGLTALTAVSGVQVNESGPAQKPLSHASGLCWTAGHGWGSMKQGMNEPSYDGFKTFFKKGNLFSSEIFCRSLIWKQKQKQKQMKVDQLWLKQVGGPETHSLLYPTPAPRRSLGLQRTQLKSHQHVHQPDARPPSSTVPQSPAL